MEPAGRSPPLCAIVLCGGRGLRMGGVQKCLLELAGRPLLAHVIERLDLSAQAIAVSANAELDVYENHCATVLADAFSDSRGPLAGILAGLEHWARLRPADGYMLSAAGDTPFFPRNLGHRLVDAGRAGGDRIAVAAWNGSLHPTFAAWPLSAAPHLRERVTIGADLSIMGFLRSEQWVTVDFAGDAGQSDPFFNVNSPDDLAAAERLLAAGMP
jgi:molybdopterin-guanine dinucleotide biosynthesis protein A